jgi:hypothetical protein
MSVGLHGPCVLIALSLGVAGCISVAAPTAHRSELSVVPPLLPEGQGSDAWVYRAPDADLKRHVSFLIEPVQIYRGPEATFSDLSAADLTELTQLVGTETEAFDIGTRSSTTDTAWASARDIARQHLDAIELVLAE